MNRLSDIVQSQENPQRTFGNLKRMSNSERQRKFREDRKQEGIKRVTAFIHEKDFEKIKQRFPGERGGVDWPELFRTALDTLKKKPTKKKSR